MSLDEFDKMTKKLGIRFNKIYLELAFSKLDKNNDKQLEF